MPLALETVVGYSTSLTGSTTFDALTAGSNQSYGVRNFDQPGNAYLENIFATDSVGAFQLSIKSPKMHDDVYGILIASTPKTQAGVAAFSPQDLLPGPIVQPLYASDTLSVTANGTASDKFCAALQIFYTNLSGIAARLYTWEQVRPLIVNTMGQLVVPAVSATAGNWGAGALLNSSNFRMKANTDYAVLGYTSSIPCTAVAIQGTDTGNLLCGGPGGPQATTTGDWFVRQSIVNNGPRIPVINANNAPSTQVLIADTATSGTFNVTIFMAELSQRLPTPGGVI